MSDTYLALATRARTEIKVKGSRFIAEAIPVISEEEAGAEIDLIQRREFSAAHRCTAYRLGPEGAVFRYNDDGEPSGTAGAPILRQIDARALTNTLVVVTRYFGGVKLGTGGLIRAYGEAASAVLDEGAIEQHVVRLPVSLTFDYADTSPAMHTIGRFDAIVAETQYTDVTSVVVEVRRSQAAAFIDAFVEALSGRGAAAI